jgi:hypothetical protein
MMHGTMNIKLNVCHFLDFLHCLAFKKAPTIFGQHCCFCPQVKGWEGTYLGGLDRKSQCS